MTSGESQLAHLSFTFAPAARNRATQRPISLREAVATAFAREICLRKRRRRRSSFCATVPCGDGLLRYYLDAVAGKIDQRPVGVISLIAEHTQRLHHGVVVEVRRQFDGLKAHLPGIEVWRL